MDYGSNFDKQPSIVLDAPIWTGWSAICQQIQYRLAADYTHKSQNVIVVECYQGVDIQEVEQFCMSLGGTLIASTDFFFDSSVIEKISFPDVTNDRIFGYVTRLKMVDFIDFDAWELHCQLEIMQSKLLIIYGPGAALLAHNIDILIYADMARWEIQTRMRANACNNLGLKNNLNPFSEQYKRAFFVDWRICDQLKKDLWNSFTYILDTNTSLQPKLITRSDIDKGLAQAAKQPFRVVPFFDPGPWGGQWMKEVCDLDRSKENYAWCFDCVPEENSLLFDVNGTIVELPANDLVFFQSQNLLGAAVEARFGREFPIRFDFLDTMGGGNLSLQVHPTTEYIRQQFGMFYTQDESYYILDAAPDAQVYLGVKKAIEPSEMIADLRQAQTGKQSFDAGKYVNIFPAKKHDHFLIPAGTVHCSGANSMVLEISSTPFIFTFKLWDWNRMGLDGKPRPINIDHGENVIDWTRDADYAKQQLINVIEPIASGLNWREERTGLHPTEFIETRRHWFTGSTPHHTHHSVNVINLVEGREVIVESPDASFEPFIVHYAETFIIPAAVGRYTISPHGPSLGKECATLKAFVRLQADQ